VALGQKNLKSVPKVAASSKPPFTESSVSATANGTSGAAPRWCCRHERGAGEHRRQGRLLSEWSQRRALVQHNQHGVPRVAVAAGLLLGCLVLLAAGPRCEARAGAWLVPGDVRLLVGSSGISSVNTGQEFVAAMLDDKVKTVALTSEAAGLVRCCQEDPWSCRQSAVLHSGFWRRRAALCLQLLLPAYKGCCTLPCAPFPLASTCQPGRRRPADDLLAKPPTMAPAACCT